MAKITLTEVAAAAGVSTMTVSRVINDQTGVGEATRERVWNTIRQLDYRPNGMARSLKVSRSQTIGLIVPDITNPYFPEVVQGAEDAAIEHDYTVLLGNVIEQPKREVTMLRRFEERRVDGVIVCSPRLEDEQLFTLLRRFRAAVVVNRSVPAELAGTVRVDHAAGTEQAVDHLIELGRTRLALLAGPKVSRGSRERIRGFKRALERYDIAAPNERVVACPPYLSNGLEATKTLLQEQKVDGLLCYNDLIAAGALQACSALGYSVPSDIAVVGFDDIPFAQYFNPPLTTLHVPKYDIGMTAMRLLLDRLEGRNKQMEVILRPNLIIRASTLKS